MRRRWTSPATWVCTWLAVLAVFGGFDLHLLSHASSHDHALTESLEKVIPTESCTERELKHVEAAELRSSKTCPFCLRGQDERTGATFSTEARERLPCRALIGLAPQSGFLAGVHDPRVPRGPPIS